MAVLVKRVIPGNCGQVSSFPLQSTSTRLSKPAGAGALCQRALMGGRLQRGVSHPRKSNCPLQPLVRHNLAYDTKACTTKATAMTANIEKYAKVFRRRLRKKKNP